MKRRECVYVIGAGFSAGLGYPLTSDLLVRLWDRLDAPFKKKLKRVIEFHHPGFNPGKFTSFPNVEELLSEMLVNEELFDASRQYEGNFTKENLHELQRDLLLNIADWFHELSLEIRPSKPHVEWVRKLRERVKRENAAIISFNWDLIIDQLLFGEELNSKSYGFSRQLTNGPVLLKPHGSLNWFEEEPGRYLKSEKKIRIFKSSDNGDIYAFREFRAPISKAGRIYYPVIVPPVHLKRFKGDVFKTLWKNCTSVLSTAKRVVFLGYSMPSADLHAQFIIRCGFDNQIQGELIQSGDRADPTGAADVEIVNPDRFAAQRIATVVGPKSCCHWISTPAADWLS